MIIYTKDGVPINMTEHEIASILGRLSDINMESVLDEDGTDCPMGDYENCIGDKGVSCVACWLHYIKTGRMITEADL